MKASLDIKLKMLLKELQIDLVVLPHSPMIK
jgi:hypothetical protein